MSPTILNVSDGGHRKGLVGEQAKRKPAFDVSAPADDDPGGDLRLSLNSGNIDRV